MNNLAEERKTLRTLFPFAFGEDNRNDDDAIFKSRFPGAVTDNILYLIRCLIIHNNENVQVGIRLCISPGSRSEEDQFVYSNAIGKEGFKPGQYDLLGVVTTDKNLLFHGLRIWKGAFFVKEILPQPYCVGDFS